MELRLAISHHPIDAQKLASQNALTGVGAIVHFFGVVREKEGADTIAGIEYEAFEEMAGHQFQQIFLEAKARWPIFEVTIVHRIGFVPAGEASLWMEVRSGHRGEAFAACQYIIDEMKKRVPIWKRPVTAPPSKPSAAAANAGSPSNPA